MTGEHLRPDKVQAFNGVPIYVYEQRDPLARKSCLISSQDGTLRPTRQISDIFSATRRLVVGLLYIFSRERDSSAKIQFPALTRVPVLRKILPFQLRGKLSVGLSVGRYKTSQIIDNGTNSARQIRSDPFSFSGTLMGFANADSFPSTGKK